MSNYIIHNGKRPLSAWFPNNNFYGNVKDIISFSWKEYISFSTMQEAEEHLKYIFKSYSKMKGDLKLSFKVWKVIEKLKIKEM